MSASAPPRLDPGLNPVLNRAWTRVATLALWLLIVLCLAWELWLAPVRPGGSYLAAKALPLCLALPGVHQGRVYTLQWTCMLSLVYLMEGVVRAWSDPNPVSRGLALVEIALSLAFYLCALAYLRPAKQAAARRLRQADST